jgi:putative spermidine/putrescine transport system permease protein
MPALKARRRTGRGGTATISIVAWVVVAYLALPLMIIIAMSFTATDHLTFPPEGLSLRWYQEVFLDPSYIDSIWLSTKLAISSVALAAALGVPVALVLARAEFPGVGALSAFFLSPLIFPTIIIGVAMLQFASTWGFARTFTAMLFGHVVLVTPYIVRTTLASLNGFNQSLEEAALNLGASKLATFFLITLPIIKPGVIAGCLFGFIVSWIDVEVSLFNTVMVSSPIPVKIFNYVQYDIDPLIAAVSAATIYVAIGAVLLLDWIVGLESFTVSRRS